MPTSKTSKLPSNLAPADLARLTGLTTQRLNQLQRQGVIKKAGRGVYPLSAITAYCQHQRKLIQGAGAGLGLTDARRALTHEKFLVARLERQLLQGKLVPVADIADSWAVVAQVTKTRLLGVPRLVAPRLVICKTPAEAEKLIYDAIWDALSELSRTPVVNGTGGPNQADDDSADIVEDTDE